MTGQDTSASSDAAKSAQAAGASEMIIGLLSTLSQLLRSTMWHYSKHRNLTPTQIRTLLFVADTGTENCTLSALARSQGITMPTANGIINALAHRKLITRVPNPKDRRSVLLKLTSEGEKIRREIAGWEANLRRTIESLPHERQNELLQTLREIIGSLRREQTPNDTNTTGG